jgi:hypothetical protein
VETEAKSLDLPEGPALNTLKEAALRREVEFIFSANLVIGVRTNSIQGSYTPLEAFSLMLDEISLRVWFTTIKQVSTPLGRSPISTAPIQSRIL